MSLKRPKLLQKKWLSFFFHIIWWPQKSSPLIFPWSLPVWAAEWALLLVRSCTGANHHICNYAADTIIRVLVVSMWNHTAARVDGSVQSPPLHVRKSTHGHSGQMRSPLGFDRDYLTIIYTLIPKKVCIGSSLLPFERPSTTFSVSPLLTHQLGPPSILLTISNASFIRRFIFVRKAALPWAHCGQIPETQRPTPSAGQLTTPPCVLWDSWGARWRRGSAAGSARSFGRRGRAGPVERAAETRGSSAPPRNTPAQGGSRTGAKGGRRACAWRRSVWRLLWNHEEVWGGAMQALSLYFA